MFHILGSRVMSPTLPSALHQHMPTVITKPKILVSQPAVVVSSSANGPSITNGNSQNGKKDGKTAYLFILAHLGELLQLRIVCRRLLAGTFWAHLWHPGRRL
jgi:hypothetical protein